MIYPRCHFYSFYTNIDLSENFATEPSLLLKSAKSLEPETLRYSIGYQVMAK
nr:hypothetical protein [Lactococcus lactis]